MKPKICKILLLAVCLLCSSIVMAQSNVSNQQPVIDKREFETLGITPPSFNGGESALNQYIADNLRYPAIAAENGIQGRVIVAFVVETDGSVSNIEIERSVDESLNRESLRLVRQMPKWSPARDENGVPVRVRSLLPVTFRLQ